MGAATRVEEAIGSAERVGFDLVAVLESAVAAYRGACPGRGFRAELPPGPLALSGAPDLIVQTPDKHVDNAVDFSPPGALIPVTLPADPQLAAITAGTPRPHL